jgi:signal transduction histidine kinase
MRGGRDPMRARAPAPDRGRWLLIARHRAGSLEAVVAKTRLRNLAVMSAILLLIVASMGALIRFTRRAQRLAQLQMDFVAGVSHELRTPLTVIRTAAYNLRGKLANNPAQVEKYGSLIQQESERLTELVEQVLHFASAKAGKAVRPSEPVLLENLIQESLASTRSLIDAARCTVDLQLEPGLPVILGDPVSLKQVFQNLLSNAAKYGAGDHGWIGLSAARDGAAVSIRVADRGPGIPPDEQDLIFEPFFRGRRAIEDQIHGTGLGLNLVKSIVEAHGGTITVKSASGEGTVFTVRLPAAPQEYQDEFKNLAG